MRKHWVTAVVMVVLALVVTVPAWAQTCKVQTPLAGGTGTGTAEKKVQAATLKSPAVNKFEVDVQGAGAGVAYLVMVSTDTASPFHFTPVGAFLTDSLGAGEFDLKNSAITCDIQRVAVVSSGGANTLTGKLNGLLANDDAPEVQNEVQNEVENEINNLIQNEIQLQPHPQPEPQPNNVVPSP